MLTPDPLSVPCSAMKTCIRRPFHVPGKDARRRRITVHGSRLCRPPSMVRAKKMQHGSACTARHPPISDGTGGLALVLECVPGPFVVLPPRFIYSPRFATPFFFVYICTVQYCTRTADPSWTNGVSAPSPLLLTTSCGSISAFSVSHPLPLCATFTLGHMCYATRDGPTAGEPRQRQLQP